MDMNIVGWIVIGFLAGSISGWFVGTRSAQGCLPTIIVGIIGGIIGGWLAGQLGFGSVYYEAPRTFGGEIRYRWY